MKKKLIIFPFNGNGLEAFDCINDDYEFIGYADDTKEKLGKKEFFEVFSRDIIYKYPEAKVLAVIGGPSTYKIKDKIIDSLLLSEDRFATIIHPKASVSKLSKIGYNTLLMAGVTITSNAIVGNHVCILPNSVIHHDVVIEDYNVLGSNVSIAGGVKIGQKCYIGTGSSIIQLVNIGNDSLIGMSTNVIRDIPPFSKVVGNPSRFLKNS